MCHIIRLADGTSVIHQYIFKNILLAYCIYLKLYYNYYVNYLYRVRQASLPVQITAYRGLTVHNLEMSLSWNTAQSVSNSKVYPLLL